MKLLPIALVVAFFAAPSIASEHSAGLAELSVALSAKRDACAQMAQTASNKADAAFLQVDLDRDTARRQVEMDTDVYRVGHGNSQTTDYMLQRMREAADASAQQTERVAAQVAADRKAVKQCVADALLAGKGQFSAFKADKKHKSQLAAAETLMAAWLANSGEITIGKPQGSPETLAAWKAAVARVEVSSL
ncbi:hypothetical protein [Dyella sp.]|uniref:hypothetical protein n=1 Tax=Dyella sp. TaxID=1869338 RepID=UPI003F7D5720